MKIVACVNVGESRAIQEWGVTNSKGEGGFDPDGSFLTIATLANGCVIAIKLEADRIQIANEALIKTRLKHVLETLPNAEQIEAVGEESLKVYLGELRLSDARVIGHEYSKPN